MNYKADCWASCLEVKSERGNMSAGEFQRVCESTFNDGVVLSSEICAAPEYKLIRRAMPGTASNCPIMSPPEIRRWDARCLRAADEIWLSGREIGNCVTRKSIRAENPLCENSF